MQGTNRTTTAGFKMVQEAGTFNSVATPAIDAVKQNTNSGNSSTDSGSSVPTYSGGN